jgi:HEAT repeat protein
MTLGGTTAGAARRLLYLVVWAAVTLPSGAALGQDSARTVSALIRDLRSAEFEKANAAAQELVKYPQHRAQIVPALIEAIRTREWDRCTGDMRDTIARALGELKAREAVAPLLELAKSGKTIDHECVE